MKKIFENKKLLIGGIILLLIIIAIILSIVLKKDSKKDVLEKHETQKYNYYDIISYLKLSDLPDEYYGYFYKKDKMTTDSISNNIKIYMAIRKVITDKKITGNIEIKAKDVENALNSIFGPNVKYNHQSITGNNISYTSFIYDRDSKIYSEEKIDCDDCDSTQNSTIISEIIKTDDTNNIVEVYEKVGFVTTEYDLDTKKVVYNIFKDINEKELIGTTNQYSIEKYKDQLNTYKYTFKKNENSYYFEKVELVK